MASPYSGLTQEQLLKIQTNYVNILSGDAMLSTAVPGLSSSWRVDSLEAVRSELTLVNLALADLSGTPKITRTVFRAA